jgi:hypothetical protein
MTIPQQGQVFRLAGRGRDGKQWAYRYRVGGRGSKRVQRGGFESEEAATEALERVLEQLRREQGLVESPTLAELVDIYLAQPEGEPAMLGVENPQRRYTEKRPFESWEQLYTLTGTLPPRTARWCRSPRPPGSGQANGSRSSTETSTARPRSYTSAARSETDASSRPRRRRACAPFPCRRSRSPW